MTRTQPERKVTTSKLTLPTELNEPSDDLLDYFALIFGRKNVGKSTFGASYTDALNFQMERGRKNLPIRMVPPKGEKPLTFKTFKEYLRLFCDDKELRVAVIDTIDAAYELTYNYVLSQYGDVATPQQTGDGPGVWNEIKNTFDDLIAMVQDAGKSIVFISHEKAKDHTNADGTVLERIEPSCSQQAIGVVQRYCDFVFHYDWVCNDRVMTIRSTDNIVWTSCGRNDMFLDPDGEPLKRIKIPDDPEAGYETLEKAFLGELRDYDWQPPKQTKQIKPANKTGKPVKK